MKLLDALVCAAAAACPSGCAVYNPRKMSARLSVVALALVMLAACAAPGHVKFDPITRPATSRFKFVDARPAPLPRSEKGMYMTWRDEQFEPPPAVLVEHAVRRSNALPDGATVTLTEFTVSYIRTHIQQSPMASYNAFMFGAIGAGVTALLDAGASPDYCSAKVVVDVNGTPVTATASDSVSKYAAESGVRRVVEQLLARLTELVGAPVPDKDATQNP